MNDFYNSAFSAIVNVCNLLCLSFDFLLYPALGTAHASVGLFYFSYFLKNFSKYIKIPSLFFV